jgi:hypothetical protein
MTRENPSVAAFKVWIFPSLVSLVSLLIWNDVNEIKADVKLLMAQSNIDKTRIDNLERQIYKPSSLAFPGVPVKDQEPRPNEYAVLVDNRTKFIK